MHLHLHKGALHRALHIPQGQKIPDATLQGARHSRNAHMRKMANLAAAMKHWHHGGPKHGTGSGM